MAIPQDTDKLPSVIENAHPDRGTCRGNAPQDLKGSSEKKKHILLN